MVNHGVVVAGPDVPWAVVSTILSEGTLRQCLLVGRTVADAASRQHFELHPTENCENPSLLTQAWDYLGRGLE